MATKKSRIVDQPGQWKNDTPAATKKRQQKAWDKLDKDLKKRMEKRK